MSVSVAERFSVESLQFLGDLSLDKGLVILAKLRSLVKEPTAADLIGRLVAQIEKMGDCMASKICLDQALRIADDAAEVAPLPYDKGNKVVHQDDIDEASAALLRFDHARVVSPSTPVYEEVLLGDDARGFPDRVACWFSEWNQNLAREYTIRAAIKKAAKSGDRVALAKETRRLRRGQVERDLVTLNKLNINDLWNEVLAVFKEEKISAGTQALIRRAGAQARVSRVKQYERVKQQRSLMLSRYQKRHSCAQIGCKDCQVKAAWNKLAEEIVRHSIAAQEARSKLVGFVHRYEKHRHVGAEEEKRVYLEVYMKLKGFSVAEYLAGEERFTLWMRSVRGAQKKRANAKARAYLATGMTSVETLRACGNRFSLLTSDADDVLSERPIDLTPFPRFASRRPVRSPRPRLPIARYNAKTTLTEGELQWVVAHFSLPKHQQWGAKQGYTRAEKRLLAIGDEYYHREVFGRVSNTRSKALLKRPNNRKVAELEKMVLDTITVQQELYEERKHDRYLQARTAYVARQQAREEARRLRLAEGHEAYENRVKARAKRQAVFEASREAHRLKIAEASRARKLGSARARILTKQPEGHVPTFAEKRPKIDVVSAAHFSKLRPTQPVRNNAAEYSVILSPNNPRWDRTVVSGPLSDPEPVITRKSDVHIHVCGQCFYAYSHKHEHQQAHDHDGNVCPNRKCRKYYYNGTRDEWKNPLKAEPLEIEVPDKWEIEEITNPSIESYYQAVKDLPAVDYYAKLAFRYGAWKYFPSEDKCGCGQPKGWGCTCVATEVVECPYSSDDDSDDYGFFESQGTNFRVKVGGEVDKALHQIYYKVRCSGGWVHANHSLNSSEANGDLVGTPDGAVSGFVRIEDRWYRTRRFGKSVVINGQEGRPMYVKSNKTYVSGTPIFNESGQVCSVITWSVPDGDLNGPYRRLAVLRSSDNWAPTLTEDSDGIIYHNTVVARKVLLLALLAQYSSLCFTAVTKSSRTAADAAIETEEIIATNSDVPAPVASKPTGARDVNGNWINSQVCIEGSCVPVSNKLRECVMNIDICSDNLDSVRNKLNNLYSGCGSSETHFFNGNESFPVMLSNAIRRQVYQSQRVTIRFCGKRVVFDPKKLGNPVCPTTGGAAIMPTPWGYCRTVGCINYDFYMNKGGYTLSSNNDCECYVRNINRTTTIDGCPVIKAEDKLWADKIGRDEVSKILGFVDHYDEKRAITKAEQAVGDLTELVKDLATQSDMLRSMASTASKMDGSQIVAKDNLLLNTLTSVISDMNFTLPESVKISRGLTTKISAYIDKISSLSPQDQPREIAVTAKKYVEAMTNEYTAKVMRVNWMVNKINNLTSIVVICNKALRTISNSLSKTLALQEQNEMLVSNLINALNDEGSDDVFVLSKLTFSELEDKAARLSNSVLNTNKQLNNYFYKTDNSIKESVRNNTAVALFSISGAWNNLKDDVKTVWKEINPFSLTNIKALEGVTLHWLHLDNVIHAAKCGNFICQIMDIPVVWPHGLAAQGETEGSYTYWCEGLANFCMAAGRTSGFVPGDCTEATIECLASDFSDTVKLQRLWDVSTDVEANKTFCAKKLDKDSLKVKLVTIKSKCYHPPRNASIIEKVFEPYGFTYKTLIYYVMFLIALGVAAEFGGPLAAFSVVMVFFGSGVMADCSPDAVQRVASIVNDGKEITEYSVDANIEVGSCISFGTSVMEITGIFEETTYNPVGFTYGHFSKGRQDSTWGCPGGESRSVCDNYADAVSKSGRVCRKECRSHEIALGEDGCFGGGAEWIVTVLCIDFATKYSVLQQNTLIGRKISANWITAGKSPASIELLEGKDFNDAASGLYVSNIKVVDVDSPLLLLLGEYNMYSARAPLSTLELVMFNKDGTIRDDSAMHWVVGETTGRGILLEASPGVVEDVQSADVLKEISGKNMNVEKEGNDYTSAIKREPIREARLTVTYKEKAALRVLSYCTVDPSVARVSKGIGSYFESSTIKITSNVACFVDVDCSPCTVVGAQRVRVDQEGTKFDVVCGIRVASGCLIHGREGDNVITWKHEIDGLVRNSNYTWHNIRVEWGSVFNGTGNIIGSVGGWLHNASDWIVDHLGIDLFGFFKKYAVALGLLIMGALFIDKGLLIPGLAAIAAAMIQSAFGAECYNGRFFDQGWIGEVTCLKPTEHDWPSVNCTHPITMILPAEFDGPHGDYNCFTANASVRAWMQEITDIAVSKLPCRIMVDSDSLTYVISTKKHAHAYRYGQSSATSHHHVRSETIVAIIITSLLVSFDSLNVIGMLFIPVIPLLAFIVKRESKDVKKTTSGVRFGKIPRMIAFTLFRSLTLIMIVAWGWKMLAPINMGLGISLLLVTAQAHFWLVSKLITITLIGGANIRQALASDFDTVLNNADMLIDTVLCVICVLTNPIWVLVILGCKDINGLWDIFREASFRRTALWADRPYWFLSRIIANKWWKKSDWIESDVGVPQLLGIAHKNRIHNMLEVGLKLAKGEIDTETIFLNQVDEYGRGYYSSFGDATVVAHHSYEGNPADISLGDLAISGAHATRVAAYLQKCGRLLSDFVVDDHKMEAKMFGSVVMWRDDDDYFSQGDSGYAVEQHGKYMFLCGAVKVHDVKYIFDCRDLNIVRKLLEVEEIIADVTLYSRKPRYAELATISAGRTFHNEKCFIRGNMITLSAIDGTFITASHCVEHDDRLHYFGGIAVGGQLAKHVVGYLGCAVPRSRVLFGWGVEGDPRWGFPRRCLNRIMFYCPSAMFKKGDSGMLFPCEDGGIYVHCGSLEYEGQVLFVDARDECVIKHNFLCADEQPTTGSEPLLAKNDTVAGPSTQVVLVEDKSSQIRLSGDQVSIVRKSRSRSVDRRDVKAAKMPEDKVTTVLTQFFSQLKTPSSARERKADAFGFGTTRVNVINGKIRVRGRSVDSKQYSVVEAPMLDDKQKRQMDAALNRAKYELVKNKGPLAPEYYAVFQRHGIKPAVWDDGGAKKVGPGPMRWDKLPCNAQNVTAKALSMASGEKREVIVKELLAVTATLVEKGFGKGDQEFFKVKPSAVDVAKMVGRMSTIKTRTVLDKSVAVIEGKKPASLPRGTAAGPPPKLRSRKQIRNEELHILQTKDLETCLAILSSDSPHLVVHYFEYIEDVITLIHQKDLGPVPNTDIPEIAENDDYVDDVETMIEGVTLKADEVRALMSMPNGWAFFQYFDAENIQVGKWLRPRPGTVNESKLRSLAKEDVQITFYTRNRDVVCIYAGIMNYAVSKGIFPADVLEDVFGTAVEPCVFGDLLNEDYDRLMSEFASYVKSKSAALSVRAESAVGNAEDDILASLISGEDKSRLTESELNAGREGDLHSHVCDWCKCTYEHKHLWRNPTHKQFEKQCPNVNCTQYHGGDNLTESRLITDTAEVPTIETVRNEIEDVLERPNFDGRQITICSGFMLDQVDVEFGNRLIDVMRGNGRSKTNCVKQFSIPSSAWEEVQLPVNTTLSSQALTLLHIKSPVRGYAYCKDGVMRVPLHVMRRGDLIIPFHGKDSAHIQELEVTGGPSVTSKMAYRFTNADFEITPEFDNCQKIFVDSQPRIGSAHNLFVCVDPVKKIWFTVIRTERNVSVNASRKKYDTFEVVDISEGLNNIKVVSELEWGKGTSGAPLFDMSLSIAGEFSKSIEKIRGSKTVPTLFSEPVISSVRMDALETAAKHCVNRLEDGMGMDNLLTVQAPTGCGKSTTLMVKIADELYTRRGPGRKLYVCMPKRVTCAEVYYYVKNLVVENNFEDHVTVSCRTGKVKEENPDEAKTEIIYCTYGSMTYLMAGNKLDPQMNFIVLDEVHSRECTELLVCEHWLRSISWRKVIATTATMWEDPSYLRESYIVPGIDKSYEVREVPFNRMLPTDRIGSESVVIEMESEHYALPVEIFNNNRVMIFVPTYSAVDAVAKSLVKANINFREISGRNVQQSEECPMTFICTNIVESGITIKDVSRVVDFCRENKVENTYEFEGDTVRVLHKQAISTITKESRTQRKGRTGRTGPGVYYYRGDLDLDGMQTWEEGAVHAAAVMIYNLRIGYPFQGDESDTYLCGKAIELQAWMDDPKRTIWLKNIQPASPDFKDRMAKLSLCFKGDSVFHTFLAKPLPPGMYEGPDGNYGKEIIMFNINDVKGELALSKICTNVTDPLGAFVFTERENANISTPIRKDRLKRNTSAYAGALLGSGGLIAGVGVAVALVCQNIDLTSGDRVVGSMFTIGEPVISLANSYAYITKREASVRSSSGLRGLWKRIERWLKKIVRYVITVTCDISKHRKNRLVKWCTLESYSDEGIFQSFVEVSQRFITDIGTKFSEHPETYGILGGVAVGGVLWSTIFDSVKSVFGELSVMVLTSGLAFASSLLFGGTITLAGGVACLIGYLIKHRNDHKLRHTMEVNANGPLLATSMAIGGLSAEVIKAGYDWTWAAKSLPSSVLTSAMVRQAVDSAAADSAPSMLFNVFMGQSQIQIGFNLTQQIINLIERRGNEDAISFWSLAIQITSIWWDKANVQVGWQFLASSLVTVCAYIAYKTALRLASKELRMYNQQSTARNVTQYERASKELDDKKIMTKERLEELYNICTLVAGGLCNPAAIPGTALIALSKWLAPDRAETLGTARPFHKLIEYASVSVCMNPIVGMIVGVYMMWDTMHKNSEVNGAVDMYTSLSVTQAIGSYVMGSLETLGSMVSIEKLKSIVCCVAMSGWKIIKGAIDFVGTKVEGGLKAAGAMFFVGIKEEMYSCIPGPVAWLLSKIWRTRKREETSPSDDFVNSVREMLEKASLSRVAAAFYSLLEYFGLKITALHEHVVNNNKINNARWVSLSAIEAIKSSYEFEGNESTLSGRWFRVLYRFQEFDGESGHEKFRLCLREVGEHKYYRYMLTKRSGVDLIAACLESEWRKHERTITVGTNNWLEEFNTFKTNLTGKDGSGYEFFCCTSASRGFIAARHARHVEVVTYGYDYRGASLVGVDEKSLFEKSFPNSATTKEGLWIENPKMPSWLSWLNNVMLNTDAITDKVAAQHIAYSYGAVDDVMFVIGDKLKQREYLFAYLGMREDIKVGVVDEVWNDVFSHVSMAPYKGFVCDPPVDVRPLHSGSLACSKVHVRRGSIFEETVMNEHLFTGCDIYLEEDGKYMIFSFGDSCTCHDVVISGKLVVYHQRHMDCTCMLTNMKTQNRSKVYVAHDGRALLTCEDIVTDLMTDVTKMTSCKEIDLLGYEEGMHYLNPRIVRDIRQVPTDGMEFFVLTVNGYRSNICARALKGALVTSYVECPIFSEATVCSRFESFTDEELEALIANNSVMSSSSILVDLINKRYHRLTPLSWYFVKGVGVNNENRWVLLHDDWTHKRKVVFHFSQNNFTREVKRLLACIDMDFNDEDKRVVKALVCEILYGYTKDEDRRSAVDELGQIMLRTDLESEDMGRLLNVVGSVSHGFGYSDIQIPTACDQVVFKGKTYTKDDLLRITRHVQREVMATHPALEEVTAVGGKAINRLDPNWNLTTQVILKKKERSKSAPKQPMIPAPNVRPKIDFLTNPVSLGRNLVKNTFNDATQSMKKKMKDTKESFKAFKKDVFTEEGHISEYSDEGAVQKLLASADEYLRKRFAFKKTQSLNLEVESLGHRVSVQKRAIEKAEEILATEDREALVREHKAIQADLYQRQLNNLLVLEAIKVRENYEAVSQSHCLGVSEHRQSVLNMAMFPHFVEARDLTQSSSEGSVDLRSSKIMGLIPKELRAKGGPVISPLHPQMKLAPCVRVQPEVFNAMLDQMANFMQEKNGGDVRVFNIIKRVGRFNLPSKRDSGVVSRAYFKAHHLDEDLGIFKDGKRVLDATSGNGGFAQYYLNTYGREKRRYFANIMRKPNHAGFSLSALSEITKGASSDFNLRMNRGVGDVRLASTQKEFADFFKLGKADLVIYDCGEKHGNVSKMSNWLLQHLWLDKEIREEISHATVLGGIEESFHQNLCRGGTLVVKMMGATKSTEEIILKLSKYFHTLIPYKCPTTHSFSLEWYLVLKGYSPNGRDDKNAFDAKGIVNWITNLQYEALRDALAYAKACFRHLKKDVQLNGIEGAGLGLPDKNGRKRFAVPMRYALYTLPVNVSRVNKTFTAWSLMADGSLKRGMADEALLRFFGGPAPPSSPDHDPLTQHEKYVYNGHVFHTNIKARVESCNKELMRRGLKERPIDGTFENLHVVKQFDMSARGAKIDFPKGKHMRDVIAGRLSYDLFGHSKENSTVGTCQSGPQKRVECIRKRLDKIPQESAQAEADMLEAAREATCTDEYWRIVNGPDSGKFVPWDWERVCVECNKKGSANTFDPRGIKNFKEYIDWPHSKKFFEDDMENMKCGVGIPYRECAMPKEETKACKDIDKKGRIEIEGNPNIDDYKDARINLGHRMIQFAELRQRAVALALVGPVLEHHNQVKKLYKGSTTGTPLVYLGNLMRGIWDFYHKDEERDISTRERDPNNRYKCHQLWSSNSWKAHSEKVLRSLKREGLPCVQAAVGDYSGYDATINKGDLAREALYNAPLFRSDWQGAVKLYFSYYLACPLLTSDGHLVVRVAQRGSGQQTTSHGNTKINVDNLYAAIAHALGISIEEATEVIGELEFYVGAKGGIEVWKRFALTRMSVIADGDDHVVFGHPTDVKLFVANGLPFLKRCGKLIRTGNEEGYEIIDDFDDIDFCSHVYRRRRKGHRINEIPFDERFGVGGMSAVGAVDCVKKNMARDIEPWKAMKKLREVEEAHDFRIDYMPFRPFPVVVGKLAATKKLAACKWSYDTLRDLQQGRVPKLGAAQLKQEMHGIEISRGKVQSSLLLYPHQLSVVIFCLTILSVLRDVPINLECFKRGWQLKEIGGMPFVKAFQTIYGVPSILDIEFGHTSIDKKALSILLANTRLFMPPGDKQIESPWVGRIGRLTHRDLFDKCMAWLGVLESVVDVKVDYTIIGQLTTCAEFGHQSQAITYKIAHKAEGLLAKIKAFFRNNMEEGRVAKEKTPFYEGVGTRIVACFSDGYIPSHVGKSFVEQWANMSGVKSSLKKLSPSCGDIVRIVTCKGNLLIVSLGDRPKGMIPKDRVIKAIDAVISSAGQGFICDEFLTGSSSYGSSSYVLKQIKSVAERRCISGCVRR